MMVFLQGVGVSASLAVRIYQKYGDAPVGVVRSEPYRLAAEVRGIGFRTGPQRRSRPSTCRPFVMPNGPWRAPCSACTPRGPAGAVRLALTAKVAVLTAGRAGKSSTAA